MNMNMKNKGIIEQIVVKKNEKRGLKVKFKVEENNIKNDEDEESDEEVNIQKRVVVENALRNKLFNNKKGKSKKK